MVARRVRSIAGDVGTDGLGLDDAGRAALASCDIVIHSAATVSFDSPLDRAVEVNLLGPTRIAQTLTELGVAPAPRRRVDLLRRRQPPRRGAGELVSTRARSDLDVDWRHEVDGARRVRADAEAESRTPEQLDAVPHAKPAASSAPPALPLLAAKTEQRRDQRG